MTTTTTAPPFCDITITGTRPEIAQIRQVAFSCGRLVHMTTPVPAGPDDPRYRVAIRLRSDR
jgi:hypothetical protein